MNPIKWLLRDKSLAKAENKLDDHISRLKEKVLKKGSSMLVEVDVDFPRRFTELSNKIASGKVEWRDFYSNEALGIYSVHCRMENGSMLKEHRHPQHDEYLYVISGSVINWTDGISEGNVITPAEKVKRREENMRGWHKIPADVSHRIQAIEEHTHFVSKFIAKDE